jgi:HPt (histidine-containing phosphotransfer) domain-containing protein
MGKPFTSQELWACLLKYLKPVDDNDVINENIVESKEADSEFLNMLKRDFYTGNKSKFAEITGALENKDIKNAHILAHTLKSNAALIGRPGLYDIAVEIERQLAAGKKEIEKWYIERLDEELEAVLNDFAPLLEYDGKPAVIDKMLDKTEAAELFKKLKPLLISNNTDCLDYINILYRVEGSEALVEQIESYEFIAAAKTLDELETKMKERS